jgi:hypothetical protein
VRGQLNDFDTGIGIFAVQLGWDKPIAMIDAYEPRITKIPCRVKINHKNLHVAYNIFVNTNPVFFQAPPEVLSQIIFECVIPVSSNLFHGYYDLMKRSFFKYKRGALDKPVAVRQQVCPCSLGGTFA